MSVRPCAVSVLATYTDKAGLHAVHSLDFYAAADRDDAQAQAEASFGARWPNAKIVSVAIEPVPGRGQGS